MSDTTTEPWRDAGRAWGLRPRDWAYLFEPYCLPAYDAVLRRAGVGVHTQLVDIACGSGLAAWQARRLGAGVSGIDASSELLEIARDRVPDGDFRVGDMFHLPFEPGTFDVATSFNGIWFGNDAALDEIRRVLRPGGTVGLAFWGDPSTMDHAAYFLAIAACSAPADGEAVLDLGKIARPGVVERMLAEAGLELRHRGTVRCTSEWPDRGIAARAMAAPGVADHAISHSTLDRFITVALDAIEPYRTRSGYRLSSGIDYVIATRP